MTNISTGGGATIEQRRACVGLKSGTHLPGYTGYTPLRKYRIGKTYGTDTYEINTLLQNWTCDGGVNGEQRELMIPDSNGDNKYMKDMLPGYTGYVPTSPYKFGNRYRVICDYSVDEFMRANEKNAQDAATLRSTVLQQPVLKSVTSDPEVKASCDLFRDRHPNKGVLLEERRTGDEAPIPGYVGYVPKVIPTEIGLGARYHTVSHNGYEAFYNEKERQEATRNLPITLDTRPEPRKYNVNFRLDTPNTLNKLAESPTRRVYPPEGMVPHYTGYLPQRTFKFGHTYGNTSRSLAVCNHKMSNYGASLITA